MSIDITLTLSDPASGTNTLFKPIKSALPSDKNGGIAPLTSIRGYIPQYLDDELSVKAAKRRVTKTFLIMEALAKAGYHVTEADMVQDRRKRR